ncbi:MULTISPECIES: hypothetical protein [unclassified Halomonas]|uniref:hypothetical protein n=1 Tax=unclassified Halomonas TaxID=2609666 RepID=UPI0005FCDABD|nr:MULTISPECIES: hypothetical protein [unclassified Halomonas]CEP34281.1 Hemin-binding periplasmic protein hmuT [Halomonas sp. R57-5]
MKATRLIRRSLAALLVGWLTRGAALASDRLGGDIAEILAAGHAGPKGVFEQLAATGAT